MISRYSVWLNDVSLADVDPDIYISDISYPNVNMQYNSERLASRSGSFAGNRYIGENKITVSFSLRKYSTQHRQAALQAIHAWAAESGWLKVSDRPNQKIYVRMTKPPVLSSVLRWTDTLTIEFTAFDFPFWQDEDPYTVTLNNGGSDTVYIPSAFDTYTEAKITVGASLTSIEIHVGDTQLALSGLSIASGGVITISYTDDHHILEIKSGNTSLLDKRTSASSDDLIAQHGSNALSFTASASATCELYFKGVYL